MAGTQNLISPRAAHAPRGLPPPAPRVSVQAVAAGRRKAARRLSVLALASMAVAAPVGLLVDGVYGGPAATAEMLRGYDLVTLVVVVPVLAVSLWAAGRGSPVASLVWPSMLAAAAYTYGYHVFGAGFNDAFLLHVVAFSSSVFALALALSAVDVGAIGVRSGGSRTGPSVRWVSVLLMLLAVGLGGMWVVDSIRFAVSGELPAGSALVETDAVVHLGFVLDLALLVPAYALAAVLLWRRRPWGYVVGALVLLSGVVHQVGYMVALAFQAGADVPGAVAFDPFEPVIAGAFLVAAGALLAGVRAHRGGALRG